MGYMTHQIKTLISAQDEVSSLPEDQQDSVFIFYELEII